MRTRLGYTVLFATSFACAPESSVAPPALEPIVNAAWVSGDAATALDAEGRFVFAHPSYTAPLTSLATAMEQSEIFAHLLAGQALLADPVINDRDRYMPTFSMLKACARAYLVRNQFELLDEPRPSPVPVSQIPRDHWLVPLCGPFGYEMTMEVSVAHNDVRFNPEAITMAPAYAAYFPRGVPWQSPTPIPITAESAVEFAFRATGQRVAQVPTMIHRDEVVGGYAWLRAGAARECYRWRLVLAGPVRLHGMRTKRLTSTAEVYVGSRYCDGRSTAAEFHLPLAEQPAAVRITWQPVTSTPDPRYTARVRLRYPTQFEPATVAPR